MSPDEVSGLPKAEPPKSVFRFDRVFISKFKMEEAAGSPAPSAEKSFDDGVAVEIQANIAVHASNRADLTLAINITPGPTSKPYNISMDLVGTFSVEGEVPRESLVKFCQTNATAILFPYVRQAINEITSNGRFGPVRLPLLNLQAILRQGAWTETPHLQPEPQLP